MTDEKKPSLSNLEETAFPEQSGTGRIRLAVHEELREGNSALMGTLRQWWFIAVSVGALVWGAAGYLGNKAKASDLDVLKNVVEINGNRLTHVESRFGQLDRIENQLYQLALRAGATIVAQPPLPQPPLR